MVKVLGDFRFKDVPDLDDVQIRLFWCGDERMGHVNIPIDVENAMALASLPDARELPLISALGFGVVVAGQSGRRLCLTGDRSAWSSCWGQLIETH